MGKTTGVQDSNYHYTLGMYNGELQGDDLELTVLATGGGITQRRRPLPSSFSLTLSRLLSLRSLLVENRKMSNKT